MKQSSLFLFVLLMLALGACRITKSVNKGQSLLYKNAVNLQLSEGKLSVSEIQDVIRQQPNHTVIGIPFRLMLYNSVDSAKVADKRFRKNQKLKAKEIHQAKKIEEVNARRIEKARRKHREYYTEKLIPVDNGSRQRSFFREWLKYKYGEKPVLFDTILFQKSIDQIGIFLKKKGYYGAQVSARISTQDEKTTVFYEVKTGLPYVIDSVYFLGAQNIIDNYVKWNGKEERKTGEKSLLNRNLDMDYLSSYREKIARAMRDQAYFGFVSSSVVYVADTSGRNMKVKLGLEFQPRTVSHPVIKDSLTTVPYSIFRVRNVIFHLSDTTQVKESFKNYLEKNNISSLNDPLETSFLATVNSLVYDEILCDKKQAGKFNLPQHSPHPFRKIELRFNGSKPTVKAKLLELQNYLEPTNYYKEYYIERSYQFLNQLNLFSSIKPKLVEVPNQNLLDVHYFLSPSKKQSFSFEPKFTSSFGLLGVNASIDYSNRNLFHGGEKLMVTLGGGFESQPIVFEGGGKGGRVFNTIEFGPSIKLEVPGLFPVPVQFISKRQKPKTQFAVGLNFEKRDIFTRRVFQMNYTWKFLVDKTQLFTIGLPFASIVKFVKIDKSTDFDAQINSLNDLFLKNTYSNQLIWEDFKLQLEFSNAKREYPTSKGKDHSFLNSIILFNSSVSFAGNTLSFLTKGQDTMANGQKAFLGNGFAQFFRNDNQLILTRNFKSKLQLATRLMAGAGVPYGNSKTSMPYDYSFFAGGSNDNRGWKARSLGPGNYKYYRDSSGTATQIGDIRLGGSVELRIPLGSTLKTAVFADFGNIWTYKKDINRPGSEFTSEWYKQLALTLGTGIRLDLGYFLVRLDVGFPFYNPSLPDNARWVFQKRDAYYLDGAEYYGITSGTDAEKITQAKPLMAKPFLPSLNFGIGLPF